MVSKNNTQKTKIIKGVLFLLSLSFFTALISDLVYENIANAEIHAVGIFLSGLSKFSFTLSTLVVLLGGLWLIFFKRLFGDLMQGMHWKERYEEEIKSKEKQGDDTKHV